MIVSYYVLYAHTHTRNEKDDKISQWAHVFGWADNQAQYSQKWSKT